MRIRLASLALLVALGMGLANAQVTTPDGSYAYHTDRCSGTDCTNLQSISSPEQDIIIKIPAVVRLVIDNPADFTPWKVDLSGFDPNGDAAGYPSPCFVLPNWVDTDSELTSFLADANFRLLANGSIGGLLVGTEGATGYPPVFYGAAVNGQKPVLSWSDVAQAGSPYVDTDLHANAPAKGHLLCANTIKLEKFTNCDGIDFSVNVAQTDSNGAFGTLVMQDYLSQSGIADTPMAGDLAVISTASPATLYQGIPMNSWLDDDVLQAIYLKNADNGKHTLTATFTVGNP